MGCYLLYLLSFPRDSKISRRTPMLVAQRSLALSPIPILSNPSASPAVAARRLGRLLPGALTGPLLLGPGERRTGPYEVTDTLKILEWDKLCDAVAAFSGTSLGRDATKVSLPLFSWSVGRVCRTVISSWVSQAQLSHVDVSFEESNKLLEETAAVVELINYGAGGLDFAGVDTVLVRIVCLLISCRGMAESELGFMHREALDAPVVHKRSRVPVKLRNC